MTSISNDFYNVQMYISAVSVKKEFSRQNQERIQHLSWIQPVEMYCVQPLASYLTEKITIPFLTKGYAFLGQCAISCSKQYDPVFSKKIEEGWYDPVSFKTLANLAHRVKHVSRKWAERQPSTYPFLEEIDCCTIVIARYFYVFSNDASDLLVIPAKLRKTVKEICKAADEEIITPINNDFIRPVEDTIETISNTAHAIKNEAVAVAAISIARLPYFAQNWIEGACEMVSNCASQLKEQAVSYMPDEIQSFLTPKNTQPMTKDNCLVEASRDKLRAIKEEANQKIPEIERTLRMDFVTRTVNSVVRETSSVAWQFSIRAVLGLGTYELVKHTILIVTPEDPYWQVTGHVIAEIFSCSVTLTGAILWYRCLTPTAKKLREKYHVKFNPSSTLRDLLLPCVDKVTRPLINVVKNCFKCGGTYFDNFSKRAEQIIAKEFL